MTQTTVYNTFEDRGPSDRNTEVTTANAKKLVLFGGSRVVLHWRIRLIQREATDGGAVGSPNSSASFAA